MFMQFKEFHSYLICIVIERNYVEWNIMQNQGKKY